MYVRKVRIFSLKWSGKVRKVRISGVLTRMDALTSQVISDRSELIGDSKKITKSGARSVKIRRYVGVEVPYFNIFEGIPWTPGGRAYSALSGTNLASLGE